MDFEQKYQKDPGMNRVKESPQSIFIKIIFISWSVQETSLFEWVATVEGPSDPPYQVFVIE